MTLFNICCSFIPHIFIHSFIHSFCSLSYDRSIASCKLSCPQSAIECCLFQFPVFSRFLKVIKQQLTSSLSSHYFYPSFYLSFSNMFQQVVPAQDMTSPVILPSFYCMQNISLLHVILFIFHKIVPTDHHSSPAPNFKIFQVFLIYSPQCPSFSTIQNYAPSVTFHQFLHYIEVQFNPYRTNVENRVSS